MSRKPKRKPTERELHRRLERAASALILSARVHVVLGKPWPKISTIPEKPLLRVAELLNQLNAVRATRKGKGA